MNSIFMRTHNSNYGIIKGTSSHLKMSNLLVALHTSKAKSGNKLHV